MAASRGTIARPSAAVGLIASASIDVPYMDRFAGVAGTSLVSHTADVGGTWTRDVGTVVFQLTAAGRIRLSNTGTTHSYHHSYHLGSADYDVSCDVTCLSLITDGAEGVTGRVDPVTDSYYLGRYDQFAGEWQIYPRLNGADGAMLGSSTAFLLTNRPYRLTLRMRGTAISLLVDGVLLIGPVTDSSISAAGYAGVWGEANTTAPTDSTGYHLDNWDVVPALTYQVYVQAGAVGLRGGAASTYLATMRPGSATGASAGIASTRATVARPIAAGGLGAGVAAEVFSLRCPPPGWGSSSGSTHRRRSRTWW